MTRRPSCCYDLLPPIVVIHIPRPMALSSIYNSVVVLATATTIVVVAASSSSLIIAEEDVIHNNIMPNNAAPEVCV